jgi:hypothetical protein
MPGRRSARSTSRSGRQTDLAQALWRVRHDRGVSGLARFVQRFRAYDIGDQDGIARWTRVPGMFYILSRPPGIGVRHLSRHVSGGDESLTSHE